MSMRTIFVVGGLVLALSGPGITLAADEPSARDAALSTIAVKVFLIYNYANQAMIIADFSTNDPNKHSVYCASAFRDLHYTLRDASGRTVRGDPDAWRKHTELISGGQGSMPGAPDPCKTVKAAISERRVLLSDLYPHLAKGTYSLQVVLAPRGIAASAAMAPIKITLGPNATRASAP
jgi:hypothetical protein